MNKKHQFLIFEYRSKAHAQHISPSFTHSLRCVFLLLINIQCDIVTFLNIINSLNFDMLRRKQ
jgi:hypothetical protein